MEQEDIDSIMQEMEAKTPKSGDKEKTFDLVPDEIPEFPANGKKETNNGDKLSTNGSKVPDKVDAKGLWDTIFTKTPIKPGKIHPSKPTDDRYYDFTNANVGYAVIFNQITVNGENKRNGSQKDAEDLTVVLSDIGFNVIVHKDLSVKQIREELVKLSQRDHSDNDCLLIAIMTHGKRDGKIFASDDEFHVHELWEKFTGTNCATLIGKPKLFFIQACRGSMTDPGTAFKPKPSARMRHVSDQVDAKVVRQETYVIPKLADLLVMYSTAEGYYSFRNPKDGSWFIQALCEELRENSHEDLLTILTGVNRRVAFAKQSFVPDNEEWDAMKQMPNIMSMLTKIMYFKKKPFKELKNA